MDYKKFIDRYQITEQTKDRLYENTIQKKEKNMNFMTAKIGKIAFFFITTAILVTLGVGIWYATTLPKTEPKTTIETTSEPSPQETSYVLAFSGGYNRSRIPFGTDDFDENGEIIQTVKNLEELRNFSDEKNFPFFNESDEKYSADLSKKVREYDDEFFKDRSLILLFTFSEEYDLSRFEDLRVENGILTITLASPEEGNAISPLNAFVYLIETPKSVIERVKVIQTEKTQKGERSDYYGKMFYPLELPDLVADGEIDETDIQDMAYFYDDVFYYGQETIEVGSDYKPRKVISETISEETQIIVYLCFVNDWRERLGYNVSMLESNIRMLYNISLDEFFLDIATFDGYYGTYNGYMALKLTYDFSMLRENAHESLQSFLADYSTFVLWKPAEEEIDLKEDVFMQ